MFIYCTPQRASIIGHTTLMLEINLLTKRFEALREWRKMNADEPCDYLTMLEDDQVAKHVMRKVKQQRIEAKISHQMLRRRGMSAVGSTFLGANGEPNRDVLKPPKAVGKKPEQQFSRCLFCNTEFTDAKGKSTLSSFAFCGETLYKVGNCKRLWLASRHVAQPVKPKFNMVTPEDVDHAERTRPMMPRPANVGSGRGSKPLPPNTEWVWDNEVGYRVVNKQK